MCRFLDTQITHLLQFNYFHAHKFIFTITIEHASCSCSSKVICQMKKKKHSQQTDTLYTHLTCGLQKLQNLGFK